MEQIPAETLLLLGSQVFVSDRLSQSDVAIVFGMTLWRRPVDRAVQLFSSGMTSRLLLSGGFNKTIDGIEANEMSREARLVGIPDSAILVEPRSRNTFENILFSKALIDDAIGLENIQSITLVAIQFHMRRVLMMAERAFPPRILLGTASYPSVAYTNENWMDSERGRHDVATEVMKIRRDLDPMWPGNMN